MPPTEPTPTIAVVAIQDLLPDVRAALERAHGPEGWNEAAVQEVVQHEFGFLGTYTSGRVEGREGRDYLVLTFTPPPGRDLARAEQRFDSATALADRGRLEPARQVFSALVEEFPEVARFHRALGQAEMVLGRADEAETALLHGLRLDPLDPDSLTLLGNVYYGQGRLDQAVPLFERSVALSPNTYAFSSLGAALSKLGKHEEAIRAFEQAATADPQHPNAWYGLALALTFVDRPQAAIRALHALDRALEVVGTRSRSPGLWDAAQALVGELAPKAAEEQQPVAAKINRIVAEAESTEFEVPVRLVETPLEGVDAKVEFAWLHGAREHRILIQPTPSPQREYFVRHVLERLRLTDLARRAGRNRWFSGGATERALESMGQDLARLRNAGMPAETLAAYAGGLIDSTRQQLYNAPIDLLIDRRLHEAHPEIRELLFNAIRGQLETWVQAVEDEGVKERTPRLVYRANTAMNGALALWFDAAYPRRTNLVQRYQGTVGWPIAKQLYGEWSDAVKDWEPGAELDWVDDWARRLGLQEWYSWVPDTSL